MISIDDRSAEGGGSEKQLAIGGMETMEARLAGLALPNSVVMSQVTARHAQGTCDLNNVGSQVHEGVAAGKLRRVRSRANAL